MGVGNDDTVRIAVLHEHGEVEELHIELDFDAAGAREFARLLAEAADATE